jgi:dGTPase
MTHSLLTRKTLEQWEKQYLASFAVVSADSCGRRHCEPEHEYRTCFQRDRDRIIHSAAFRRLEAKTQVFLEPGSDYYRTRLTHTMEVAQIARTMARILSLNEDLAEATALAHDLGHPPYGHSGEAVLNELMADHGGFEHNRQSLRIVEYLEHPYPSFRGLNLTYETRECLAKHESRYDMPAPPAEFGGGFAPLEGQVADLADAIAYNSHDLDDALACGLIRESDLESITIYQNQKQQIEQQFPQAKRHARQLRCAKGIIDILVMDALTETRRRLEQLNPRSPEDVRKSDAKIVTYSPGGLAQLKELEEFLMSRVYCHPDVVKAQQQARLELETLFQAYVNDPSLLPQRYQDRLDEQDSYLVICDYLAGMTDRFCRNCYESLRG